MQYDPQIMQELFQILQNPAGQQLISLLQKNGGTDLQKAIGKAESGDYNEAKQAISSLLNDPEAKKLLEQLGGKHG